MEKFGVRRSTILPLPSSPHCAPSTAMFVAIGPQYSSLIRGASPLGLPYSVAHSPLRRLAPLRWLTRFRSFAEPPAPSMFVRYVLVFSFPRGFAPRTPRQRRSLAASPARSAPL